VTEPVYREGYRVEERTRPLSPEEEALVREQRAEWDAEVSRSAFRSSRELVVGLAFAVVVAVVGIVRRSGALVFGGALMTALLAVLVVVARRAAGRTIAASKGPWSAPEGGFQIREIVVIARSVVGAASGDEDYVTWLLYEIPGGAWFFVDPLCVPAPSGASIEALARARLRLTMLSSNGVVLSVEASGDPIPHHGADLSSEGYASAMERDFVWAPEDEHWRGNADGLVPEAALPATIREAARAP
jgi:hypothetical protein